MKQIIIFTFALIIGLILFGLFLAIPVRAQESDFETALNQMVSSTGADYVTARAAAIENAAVNPQALVARLDASTWSTSTWQADWAASVVDAYMNHRNAVDKIFTARGVQPSFYLKKRRPEPEVGRDFKRTVGETWPVLIEVYAKTFNTYPFAGKAAYGQRDATERARLRVLENQALKEGILWALPWAKESGLEHFFSEVMASPQEAVTLRQVAALGLGRTKTATAVSTLVTTINDTTTPVEIRSACLRGLAQVHSEAAYDGIVASITSTDNVLSRQALASLGNFGSAWKWSDPNNLRGFQFLGNTLRKRATKFLGGILLNRPESVDADTLFNSLILIGHPDAKGYFETAMEMSNISEAFAKKIGPAHQRLIWRLSR